MAKSIATMIDLDDRFDFGHDKHDEGARLTWQDVAIKVCAAKREEGCSEGYVNNIAYVVRTAAEWCSQQPENYTPQKFNSDVARKRLAAVQGSPRNRQQHSIRLKTVFTWLFVQGYFPRDMLDRLQNPKKVQVINPRHAVTESEYNALKSANNTWYQPDNPNLRGRHKNKTMCQLLRVRNNAMITLSIDAGLRRSEVVALTMDMLHLDAGLLCFPAAKHKSGKISAQARVCAITEETIRGDLGDWLAIRSKIARAWERTGRSVPPNVFLSEKCMPMTPNGWHNEFHDIVIRANLDRRITTHSLRRTCSTAMDLVDVDASMAQLVHTSKHVHSIYNEFGALHIAKLKKTKQHAGLFGPTA